jgi:AraC-like DNA-binding protein
MSRLDIIRNWPQLAAEARYNSVLLAQLCGVSGSQLRRYFAAKFSLTPCDWMRELRLWRAARLLCSGRTLKEVVWELSYSDKSLLCRQFKEYHGCSPSEFVRLYGDRQLPARSGDTRAECWDLAERALSAKVNSRFSTRLQGPGSEVVLPAIPRERQFVPGYVDEGDAFQM